MILQIHLDGNSITLALKDGRKIVDTFSWIGEYSLNENLLPNINTLLEKNKIDKRDIEKVVAKITKTSGVTSARIVQTVANGWNMAVKLDKQ